MKYRFTKHFWDKWKERGDFFLEVGLSPEKIVDFTFSPDFVMPDPKRPEREWRIKRIGDRCLKIVVEVERNTLIIVTAYFDRTLRRKGLCK